MSPEGPEPTIATGGLVATSHGLRTAANRREAASGCTSFSRSGRNHSSWPMAIGSFCRHTPWHCSSCGHTRPVTSGSGLLDSISSSASVKRPLPIRSITCGMWIETGHPPLGSLCSARNTPSSQGFSSHCLSRITSSHTNRSTSRAV